MESAGKRPGRRSARTVLITGGAGFTGSHLAVELSAAGYGVRILGDLEELGRAFELMHGRGDGFVKAPVNP